MCINTQCTISGRSRRDAIHTQQQEPTAAAGFVCVYVAYAVCTGHFSLYLAAAVEKGTLWVLCAAQCARLAPAYTHTPCHEAAAMAPAREASTSIYFAATMASQARQASHEVGRFARDF